MNISIFYTCTFMLKLSKRLLPYPEHWYRYYHQVCHALVVSAGSSQKDIRERFKKLALKWHPDKNFHNPDESQKVRTM